MVEEIEEDPPAPQSLVCDQYSAFRSPRSLHRGRGSLKATGHLSFTTRFFAPIAVNQLLYLVKPTHRFLNCMW